MGLTADLQKDHASLPFIGRFTIDAGGFLYFAPDAVLEFLAHDVPAAEGAVFREGKIIAWRDYFDMNQFTTRMG